MEITKLTKSDYSECPLGITHHLAQISAHVPMHHITRYGSIVAWDVRDRTWSIELNADVQASRALSASPGRELADLLSRLA
jgi:hypothetical protein